MASDSVVVRPGMLPATTIVAPNSPMRAGEGEQRAAEDAAGGERQGDGEEDPRAPGPQRARHLLQPRIDLLEGHPRAAHQQREGHHRHRQHHRPAR